MQKIDAYNLVLKKLTREFHNLDDFKIENHVEDKGDYFDVYVGLYDLDGDLFPDMPTYLVSKKTGKIKEVVHLFRRSDNGQR